MFYVQKHNWPVLIVLCVGFSSSKRD